MDTLAEKLDARLREWKPETAAEARERIAEVIELADHGVLDIARSNFRISEHIAIIRRSRRTRFNRLDDAPHPMSKISRPRMAEDDIE